MPLRATESEARIAGFARLITLRAAAAHWHRPASRGLQGRGPAGFTRLTPRALHVEIAKSAKSQGWFDHLRKSLDGEYGLTGPEPTRKELAQFTVIAGMSDPVRWKAILSALSAGALEIERLRNKGEWPQS